MKHIIEIESKRRTKKNGKEGVTYMIYVTIDKEKWPYAYLTKKDLTNDFHKILRKYKFKEK